MAPSLPAVCPLVSKENEKRVLLSADPDALLSLTGKRKNKNLDYFLL